MQHVPALSRAKSLPALGCSQDRPDLTGRCCRVFLAVVHCEPAPPGGWLGWDGPRPASSLLLGADPPYWALGSKRILKESPGVPAVAQWK